MQAWYFHDDGMVNFNHTPPYINTPMFFLAMFNF
jgi:hypothetical protein